MQDDDAPRFVFRMYCKEGALPVVPGPDLYPETVRERVEWAWQYYQAQLDMCEWIPDDRIPFLSLITGTEIGRRAFPRQMTW